MNEKEKKQRHVIIVSLAGILIGTLLFIFGLSIKDNALPMVINYVTAIVLYICSFLALYNNNKKESQAVYKYIMVLIIIMIILITFAIIMNLI